MLLIGNVEKNSGVLGTLNQIYELPGGGMEMSIVKYRRKHLIIEFVNGRRSSFRLVRTPINDAYFWRNSLHDNRLVLFWTGPV